MVYKCNVLFTFVEKNIIIVTNTAGSLYPQRTYFYFNEHCVLIKTNGNRLHPLNVDKHCMNDDNFKNTNTSVGYIYVCRGREINNLAY